MLKVFMLIGIVARSLTTNAQTYFPTYYPTYAPTQKKRTADLASSDSPTEGNDGPPTPAADLVATNSPARVQT